MTAHRPADDDVSQGLNSASRPVHRNRKAATILAAARELFVSQGFDAVSMDMVARQAPVSKATLYAHFASKEDLFAAVVIEEAERITDEIWQITHDGDVDTVLRRVAQRFNEIFLSPEAILLQRAVISVVPRFPAIGVAIFDSGPRALAGHLERFLAEAHRGGRLVVPCSKLAARQFLSLVRGDLDIRAFLMPASATSSTELAEQIDAGIEMFMRQYSGGSSQKSLDE